MNTPEHLNIAQWVIDNRYPKSELDKISDFELYTELSDKIQAHTQAQIDKALTVAANVAEIEANEYQARIATLEQEIISLRGNSTAASNLLGNARDEIKELKKQLSYYADINQNQ